MSTSMMYFKRIKHFFRSYAFFQLIPVLLNVFMNWFSNAVLRCLILIITVIRRFLITIFVSTSRRRSIYVVSMWSIVHWWWWWWWWWWIVFVVWLTYERGLALFPAGTIVRDPHHRESPTRREQDLNLRRTWVQA